MDTQVLVQIIVTQYWHKVLAHSIGTQYSHTVLVLKYWHRQLSILMCCSLTQLHLKEGADKEGMGANK